MGFSLEEAYGDAPQQGGGRFSLDDAYGQPAEETRVFNPNAFERGAARTASTMTGIAAESQSVRDRLNSQTMGVFSQPARALGNFAVNSALAATQAGQDGQGPLARALDFGFDALRPATGLIGDLGSIFAPATGVTQDRAAEARAYADRVAMNNPRPVAVEEELQRLMTPGGSPADFFGEIANSPGLGARAVGSVAGESFVRSLPMLAAFAAGGPMAGGLVSAGMERQEAIDQSMAEAGFDPADGAAREAFFQDAGALREAREGATRRGASIGLLDAASGALAGRATAGLTGTANAATRTSTGLRNVAQRAIDAAPMAARVGAAGAAELAGQAALGGAGEYLGQLAENGELSSWGEVLMEALAEVGSAPVEVTIGLVRNAPDSKAGQAVRNILSRGQERRAQALIDESMADEAVANNPATYWDNEQIAVLERLGVTDPAELVRLGQLNQSPEEVINAIGAFRLADRQRQRIEGEQTRDTQAGGRPTGVDVTEEILLDEGLPVRATGRQRTAYDQEGNPIVQVEVERYDPRDGSADPDSTRYYVPQNQLETANFTRDPRQAQDFVDRAQQITSPVVTQRGAGAFGQRAAPERGRLAEEGVRREPVQTFRAGRPDVDPMQRPFNDGEPIPSQTRRRQGQGPFRRFSTTEEIEIEAERVRRDRQRDAEAEAAYAQERANRTYSSEPRVDEEGSYATDQFGYVLATNGAPVLFTDKKQMARALLAWQKQSRSGQNFQPANYPAEGVTGWTIQEVSRTTPDEDGGSDGGNNGPDGGNSGPQSPSGLLPPPEPPFGNGQGNASRSSQSGPSEDTDTPAAAAQPEPEAAPTERPRTLIEFILEKGGIKSDRGDLAAMEPNRVLRQRNVAANTPFKRSRLLREDGIELDKMRELAEEAGYIGDGDQSSDINELIDAIAAELDGNAQYARSDQSEGAQFEQEQEGRRAEERGADKLDNVRRVVRDKSLYSLTDDQIETVAERVSDSATDEEILDAVLDYLDEIEQFATYEASRAERPEQDPDAGPLFDEGAQRQGDILDQIFESRFGNQTNANPIGFAPQLARELYRATSLGARTLKHYFEQTTALSGISDAARKIFEWGRGRAEWAQATSYGRALAPVRRRKSQTGDKFLREFFRDPGFAKEADVETFDSAVERVINEHMNRFMKVVEKHLPRDILLSDNKKSREAVQTVMGLVSRQMRNNTIRPGTAAGDIAAEGAAIFKDLRDYLVEAGVEIGEVRNGFLPRILDKEMLLNDKDGFIDAATEVLRRHKVENPRDAARTWYDYAVGLKELEGEFSVSLENSMPDFMKGRKLEKWVDEDGSPLAKYYIQDTRELLGAYVVRAARVAEWTRRMGKDGARWKNEIEPALREEGLTDKERQVVAWAVSDITGFNRSGSRSAEPETMHIMGFLRMVNALGLLERSTITSIPEIASPAIRSGRFTDIPRTAYRTISGLWRAKKYAEIQEFMLDMGLIANVADRSYMAMRWVHLDPIGKRQSHIMDKYFRRVGLEQYTRATRVAAVEMGGIFIRRQVIDYKKNKSGLAARNLRELGIDESQIDALARFIDRNGLYPSREAVERGGEAGVAYRTAIHAFMDQSIMRPSRATRPAWAQHGIGSLIFQLTSFLWTFGRNVLWRTARTTAEGARGLADNARGRGELTPYENIRLMLGPLTALMAYTGLAIALSMARDELMDKRRVADLSSEEMILRHLSRAGIFSQLDPLINSFTGVRYNRSVAESLIGPALGRPADAVDRFLRLAAVNNPGTNAAERSAAVAMYDIVFEPGFNLAVSAAPFPAGGWLGKSLFAGSAAGTQIVGAPDSRDAVVTFLAGPEGERRGGGGGGAFGGGSGGSSGGDGPF